jgi:hypothetical protein
MLIGRAGRESTDGAPERRRSPTPKAPIGIAVRRLGLGIAALLAIAG